MNGVPSELITNETFKIRTSEINAFKEIRIAALVNLMQEAAMKNVIDLKLSVWDMEQDHLSWVLMKKYLNIKRLPHLGEKITIQTHPSGFDRLLTYRDYRVFDEQGVEIAHSSSTWLLMDTNKRKMTGIPEAIRSRGTFDTRDCLPRCNFEKFSQDETQVIREFDVNWHDLDFNIHLNNVRYLQWLLETVTPYLEGYSKLRRLEISYKNECLWKDRVAVETSFSGQTYKHQLRRRSDEQIIAEAKTFWH